MATDNFWKSRVQEGAVLNPVDRISEVLFGLIMVLTFTGAISVATGLEFTLSLGRFELYSEMEYLFDANTSENNFYYNWSDLTYSPTDWLWVGISGQRTRLYETDLDIQRGLILGGGWKNLELTTYFYNIGTDDHFILLTFTATF